jgi:hypothetical protein
VKQAGARGAQLLQLLETEEEKDGRNLGMTMKSLPGRLLSKLIYKICTLLSTDIVEKAVPRKPGVGW